ncbi:hypothetical protein SAMN02745824_2565 [Parasphingorhabdus marina DSM 22363]|uniref:WYL domain-containing protein n=1 Tax=Parasphingorhabdus marina DSM 22363 TaxID=1123272 RepID=A0A1N6FVQ3_9SPHN|nr:hypothetical protein [Parasphingorhabdus marina]SIN99312.1 hypothetical protein SAMN02745824_2565 [Parasphingorhabdus marina DSM 22363]
MLPNKEFLEGVALKKCVTATYNRTSFKLAPHILYTRHDEMYVDAVALEHEGQPPREIKLGTFKLAGLKDVSVEDQSFELYDVFDPSAEKYQGTTLLAVEA